MANIYSVQCNGNNGTMNFMKNDWVYSNAVQFHDEEKDKLYLILFHKSLKEEERKKITVDMKKKDLKNLTYLIITKDRFVLSIQKNNIQKEDGTYGISEPETARRVYCSRDTLSPKVTTLKPENMFHSATYNIKLGKGIRLIQYTTDAENWVGRTIPEEEYDSDGIFKWAYEQGGEKDYVNATISCVKGNVGKLDWCPKLTLADATSKVKKEEGKEAWRPKLTF